MYILEIHLKIIVLACKSYHFKYVFILTYVFIFNSLVLFLLGFYNIEILNMLI